MSSHQSTSDQTTDDEMPQDSSPATMSKRSRLIQRLLVFVSIPPLLAAIASFFGRYFFLSELLVNFQIQLAVILAVFAVLMSMLRWHRWSIVLFLAAVGVGMIPMLTLQPVANPYPLPANATKIRLMSFNVLALNRTPEKAIKCIQEYDPDIVLVIEFADLWGEWAKPLHESYPYRVEELRWHGFGIAVFSKFQLSNTVVTQTVAEATDVPLISTDVTISEKETFSLFATHLLAPMDPVRMSLRNRQMVDIADMIGDTKGKPTILAGDFNCVPWSWHLRQLLNKTQLRDSRPGRGYHASWPTNLIPMRIPIDHAFLSDRIFLTHRELLGQTGSDHFPLLIEFSISE